MSEAPKVQEHEKVPVITSESDGKPVDSIVKSTDIKIIVKQPKVQKIKSEEKKPRTEGQIKAMEKMKEALAIKRQAKIDSKKAEEEAERKGREDAVKKAEEDAKKITDNVEVQKVRGRKIGTKNPPKLERDKQSKERVPHKADPQGLRALGDVFTEGSRSQRVGYSLGETSPVRTRSDSLSALPPPLSHTEYAIGALRKKGVHVPDNVTPYMLKMIMSRYR